MSDLDRLVSIDTRYSNLAETECCLSCGGAIDHAEPQLGETCVDLGCGRGQDVARMAEAVGPHGFVWGVDTAEGMLARAQRTADKLGTKNVRFVRSAFEQIDIPDQSVDLVLSNCSINHAADKRRVWSEIRRILRPGGRFVVSDIYSTADVPDEYRNDPVAVAECWAGSVRRDEYMDTLFDTGFTDVSVLEESKPYPKGKIEVASFTVTGRRGGGSCGCSC